MDKQELTIRIRDISQKIAADRGLELVHIEIAGTKRDVIVRIYIDKPEGVTLDDCGSFSRDVEAVLDVEDFIASKYVLEVSSPGIERELYSLKDFERFKGQLAKVKTIGEIDGQKTFVGTIDAIEGESITINDRSRGPVTFNYSDVAKANLRIDLSKEFGR